MENLGNLSARDKLHLKLMGSRMSRLPKSGKEELIERVTSQLAKQELASTLKKVNPQ